MYEEKIDFEDLTLSFDKNFKNTIAKASIVKDFEKFIELANNGSLELSKTDTLSANAALLVNETIERKTSANLKRPLLKSFPNVLSLFILFNVSGLRRDELKGKKKYLKLNDDVLEQWKAFSEIEKYFTLFSLAFTNFSFELIHEDKGVLELDSIISFVVRVSKEKGSGEIDREYHNSFKSKAIIICLEMLGLIDVKIKVGEENKGWKVLSIRPKGFSYEQWKMLHDLQRCCVYYGFIDDSDDDTAEFNVNDIEGIGRNDAFSDKITEQIPAFSKRLVLNIERRVGIYHFKVSLGKVWRLITIDYRDSLDTLCQVILESFNFDFDHLYDVTFMSTLGHRLTFNGAPVIDYAEYPSTSDITIGDLPIYIAHEMKFTYDYGDNWKFTIRLTEVIPLTKKEESKPLKPKVIDKHGKAPKQYEDWGY